MAKYSTYTCSPLHSAQLPSYFFVLSFQFMLQVIYKYMFQTAVFPNICIPFLALDSSLNLSACLPKRGDKPKYLIITELVLTRNYLSWITFNDRESVKNSIFALCCDPLTKMCTSLFQAHSCQQATRATPTATMFAAQPSSQGCAAATPMLGRQQGGKSAGSTPTQSATSIRAKPWARTSMSQGAEMNLTMSFTCTGWPIQTGVSWAIALCRSDLF